MILEEELSNIPQPKIYKRQGTSCFYDPYRENMVPATPEEEVRQKLLIWLAAKCHVPQNMILVEQRLSHYGIKSQDRADIVIHKPAEDGLIMPIAVVECKAPTVSISDEVLQQCFNYTDDLGIDYAIVSNGIDIYAFQYIQETNQYMELETVPTYEQMLHGLTGSYIQAEKPLRPSFEELMNPEIQEEYYGFVGKDTPLNLRAHCINMFECLMDLDCKLSKNRGYKFTILEDSGMIRPKYGNAAGGEFVTPCRAFLIKDNHGSSKLVSLGISSYVSSFSKTKTEKTALCVGIKDKNKSHHALQLVYETYVNRTANKYIYTNTGRIAVGNKGSGSSERMRKKVAVELPHLYKNGTIHLGAVDANKLLMLSDPDVTALIINLIDYALLRDEYRDELSKL